MDSKNASGGDHRNDVIQPATLKIVKNFTKKMSKALQSMDALQKDLDSFNTLDLPPEENRRAIKFFKNKLYHPVESQVGSVRNSAADCANLVKSLVIPE
eukprot:228440_1